MSLCFIKRPVPTKTAHPQAYFWYSKQTFLQNTCSVIVQCRNHSAERHNPENADNKQDRTRCEQNCSAGLGLSRSRAAALNATSGSIIKRILLQFSSSPFLGRAMHTKGSHDWVSAPGPGMDPRVHGCGSV